MLFRLGCFNNIRFASEDVRNLPVDDLTRKVEESAAPQQLGLCKRLPWAFSGSWLARELCKLLGGVRVP